MAEKIGVCDSFCRDCYYVLGGLENAKEDKT